MTGAGLGAIFLGLVAWEMAPAWPWGPYLILAGLMSCGAARLDQYVHVRYPKEEDL